MYICVLLCVTVCTYILYTNEIRSIKNMKYIDVVRIVYCLLLSKNIHTTQSHNYLSAMFSFYFSINIFLAQTAQRCAYS